jgi:hypothetical protein
MIEFTPALMKLNAKINGISDLTASTGTPMNRGVTTRFAPNITAAITKVPQSSPITADFLDFPFL